MNKPGTWLWELRYEKRAKLVDLAKYLGKTASFISQVEMGKRDLPEELIEKFAKFFDKSISYIRDRVEADKTINKIRKAFLDFKLKPQCISALARMLDEDENIKEGIQQAINFNDGVQEELFKNERSN
jgi:transcriptional regulator with XRE-family HTH domain